MQLKGILAHKHPNLSTGELFAKLCELGLKEWDPAKSPAAPRVKKPSAAVIKTQVNQSQDSIPMGMPLKQSALVQNRPCKHPAIPKPNIPLNKPNSRHIATPVKRLVFQRAQAKCQNCNSTYALQIDHIIPFAHGGTSDSGNLRVLCRHCNQRAAIQKFARNKMSPYLEKT